ncbi:MAG TPA: PQQ-binding-like beta-propeller repeat protein, partial [Vicinamibacterales bacterium]|nr:PQQ-binding-like beta-propeller repeat protein [Vicinamibacterales bacterium]
FLSAVASAQTAPDGAAVFQKACASCHLQPAAGSRAPGREVLAAIAPEAILTTLTTGNMFRQGSELTEAERRAVAAFLAGRPVGTPAPAPIVGRCAAAAPPLRAADFDNGWNGWGASAANTRYATAARTTLKAADVPKLKLKWAIGFAGVNSARAQPAVIGDRVFVGSESGDVLALNAKTGCTYWRYHAQAGIRSAISVGPYKRAGQAGYAVYFADGTPSAYAVDANTGQELWSRKLDDHTFARATGSPTLYNGRLYVPLAGVGEEGQGGQARYECCTFRGSVSALDANTGTVVWKSYTIPDAPAARGKNAEGRTIWGPSGAGVWGAPTVDPDRRSIYITTGNNYSGPATMTSDAVIAMDMETGRHRWVFQPTPNDVWAGGCGRSNPPGGQCPETLGPDHDFSMSPVLAKVGGKDLLIVHQKSGMAYAVDPEKGTKVWEYRASAGAALGGQWGAAIDDRNAYFGVNGPGGLRGVDAATGKEVWTAPPGERLCGTVRGCSAAQGAAVTAMPGIVFAGSMDGGVRAYSAADGKVVWQFDTNREFETVNGVPAKGGAMDGPGPVVSGGMVYVLSGYVSLIGRPGNVLLAFGVD